MKKEFLILFFLALLPLVLGANGTNFYFADDTTCAPNWICADWSPCLGNNQVRTCYDNNTCGNTTNKPTETRTCGTTCTPNWECDEWQPANCENTITQARNCIDKNYCNIPNGKPTEVQTCTIKSNFSWITIFIIMTIIIIIIIFYKKSRNKHKTKTS